MDTAIVAVVRDVQFTGHSIDFDVQERASEPNGSNRVQSGMMARL